MPIPDTIPIIGLTWDDVLFVILAGRCSWAPGSLVVTMRDIIRCGLAMMVCFGALAGIYVLVGAPLVAAAQVLVYIGAISVLILFAIMLTQTKAAPARLVFQTQAVPGGDRGGRPRRRPRPGDRGDRLGRGCGPDRTVDRHDRPRRLLFNDYVLPFEIVGVLLLAAVIGGVFLAKREARRTRRVTGSVGMHASSVARSARIAAAT